MRCGCSPSTILFQPVEPDAGWHGTDGRAPETRSLQRRSTAMKQVCERHRSLSHRPSRWHATGTVASALFALCQIGCASSGAPSESEAAPAPARGTPDCIVVEVENTSLTGVTVWIEWENTSPRNMGRLSINDRRAFRLDFRNAQVSVQFQEDGATRFSVSNAILATPGDRLDIRYSAQGAGPLRRTGVARC